jgi:hypothetical protein
MDNQAKTRHRGKISLLHTVILQNKFCVNSSDRRLRTVINLMPHLPNLDLLQKPTAI